MATTQWRLLEPAECPTWSWAAYALVWVNGEGRAALFAALLKKYRRTTVVVEVFREVEGEPLLEQFATFRELGIPDPDAAEPAVKSVAAVGTDVAPPARRLTLVPAEPVEAAQPAPTSEGLTATSPPGPNLATALERAAEVASAATCPHCGNATVAEAQFCHRCGFHMMVAQGADVEGKETDEERDRLDELHRGGNRNRYRTLDLGTALAPAASAADGAPIEMEAEPPREGEDDK